MSPIDAETKALQDSIFLSKVARARRTPISEKLADGPLLFDQCCQLMRDGIRFQHPEFNDDDVEREFRRRLAIARKIDDAGRYTDAGIVDE